MKKDITVTAEVRTTRGKNEARRMRRAGRIPAVLYGGFQDPVSVAVSPRELNAIVYSGSGHNTIFNLAIDGSSTPVMIVEHQNDPIRGTLLHVDLQRIDLSKRLRVTVPARTHGEPKGIKQQSGIYEIVTRTVEIECLPDEIPESFDLDVTELMVGQNIRASDMPLTGTMKLLSAPDTVIAHVVAPRGAETTTAEAGTEAAQPDVVKKGKKEEEGGDKGGGKKK